MVFTRKFEQARKLGPQTMVFTRTLEQAAVSNARNGKQQNQTKTKQQKQTNIEATTAGSSTMVFDDGECGGGAAGSTRGVAVCTGLCESLSRKFMSSLGVLV